MSILRFILLSLLIPIIVNINAGSMVNSRVDFYGHEMLITHDMRLKQVYLPQLNQSTINGLLSAHRNRSLEVTVRQVVDEAKTYGLDGTGITLLSEKFAESIAAGKNQQNFIKYLVLKELGYDVILTRTNNRLNCLGNLSYTPGRYIYIQYNNRVYKDLDFKNRTNYAKHLVFMDSKRTYSTITRNVLRVPKVNARIESKEIAFHYGMEQHQIQARSNRSVTEFLGDLPLFDVGKEFTRLSMSPQMNRSVMTYLRKEVYGMDTLDAVKFLLSFVQQSTPYGSDIVKYGEERFYYPEETIMAGTADCEDKAILLSHLLKRVLNVNSVALYFEQDEHLSLAIAIPNTRIPGSFKYKGSRYVPCEPTAPRPVLGQSQFPLSRVSEVTPL